jgi:hypothetical protein
MSSITRRAALRTGTASLAALAILARPALACPTQARPIGGGCLSCRDAAALRAGLLATSADDITMFSGSGDAATDHFLGLALRRIAVTFGVRPGFAFYDDHRAPNAFATSRSLLPDSTGTVLMGRRLFAERMRADGDAGMTVMAICAHEFGHIHQMTHDYRQALEDLDETVRPIELHADYLAGYFLALRKQEHSEFDLQTVGRRFFAMGDTDLASPQHHGTSEERIAAITAGYQFGRAGAADIAAAAAAGLRLVRRMI